MLVRLMDQTRSSSVCLRTVSSSVCFSLPLTQLGHRRGPLQNLFPKPKRLCGSCIIISHLQFSDLFDYETPWSSTASALMAEKGSWPWHSEPKRELFPEFLLFLSSSTLSYHLKPKSFSPQSTRWGETDTFKIHRHRTLILPRLITG